MAKYQKSSMTSGAWAKSSELNGIKRAKIVSETNPQPSTFLNKDGSVKMQDVCKVKFEGKNEILNVSLNKATLNALIDSFGDDSVEWQNKILSVETEKVRVAGKAVVALYLIPKGYEKVDNEEGFAVIQKIGLQKILQQPSEEIPVINEGEEIDVKNIEF